MKNLNKSLETKKKKQLRKILISQNLNLQVRSSIHAWVLAFKTSPEKLSEINPKFIKPNTF